eukprot:12926503-Prorocentrum_lima.AAC.1
MSTSRTWSRTLTQAQFEVDEEYNSLINNHSPADVSEFLCEAYFQAKLRWRKFTGRPTRRRRFNNSRRPNARRIPHL